MFRQQKQNGRTVFHNKCCYHSNFSQMKTGAVLQGSVAYVKLRPKKSKKLQPGRCGEGGGIEVN